MAGRASGKVIIIDVVDFERNGSRPTFGTDVVDFARNPFVTVSWRNSWRIPLHLNVTEVARLSVSVVARNPFVTVAFAIVVQEFWRIPLHLNVTEVARLSVRIDVVDFARNPFVAVTVVVQEFLANPTTFERNGSRPTFG